MLLNGVIYKQILSCLDAFDSLFSFELVPNSWILRKYTKQYFLGSLTFGYFSAVSTP